jgi:hypothetical protein
MTEFDPLLPVTIVRYQVTNLRSVLRQLGHVIAIAPCFDLLDDRDNTRSGREIQSLFKRLEFGSLRMGSRSQVTLRPSSAPVVRKYSVTYGRARGSIRDAVHQGLGSHGRSMILHGDGANRAVGSCDKRAADREHPDPAPCADARHCNGESRISEWTADAIRTAGSANPGTRDESCQ